MTIEEKQVGALPGPARDEGAARSAVHMDPQDVKNDASERAKTRSSWPTVNVEDTDLERRVLAHERILQVLIAHMGETEPSVIERLRAIFSETPSRREHDYTDTHTYADEFVRVIDRLSSGRRTSAADGQATTGQVEATSRSSAPMAVPEEAAVTVFEIFAVSGIWSVTRNNRFYGHYLERRPAFDAVEEAALEIASNGGMADVVWHDTRSEGFVGQVQKREYRP